MSLTDGVDRTRSLALLTVLVALGASLQVMYHFIDVVGLPTVFLAIVALSLVAATVLARVLRPRLAVALGTALLVVGLGWYLVQLGGDPSWAALLADALSLLGGRSLLRISSVRAWVLGVTPAPVFLTWYFALRRWYTPAIVVAGGTLTFFVLTGDADAVTTLTGVVAAGAALGLGDLDRRAESVARAETVLVVASMMIIVPALVPVVPATAGAFGPLSSGPGEDGSVEANLLAADDGLTVQGDISLSPNVRFTVTSEEPNYWRVGSYDRYTGDGWVRTGRSREYRGNRLTRPPGPTRSVDQTFRVETRSGVMPAAWKPVKAWGSGSTQVRSDGSFAPDRPLANGTTYRVRSQVPDAEPRQLRNASTDSPDGVTQRYTQLPESTPDRVGERTGRLTANAESPYETARVVEQYLQNNKNYSLDVERPRGNVADVFLFEMDAGYCTYYATTMVTMLRTQDVPARLAVGYTAGERVAEDRWVVRGLNSHAWVEVYFPEYGWVEFDPTPGGPRDAVRDQRVQTARQNNDSTADTTESRQRTEWSPTGTPTSGPTTVGEGTASTGNGTNASQSPDVPGGPVVPDRDTEQTTPSGSGENDALLPRMPTRQQLALGLVAVVGAVVGFRRSGVGERAYRALWVRYQPRADPATDVERAFQRLLYGLERDHYRPRRQGETVREYLDAVDAEPAARRVAEIREQARYRGEVSADDADEAVGLVNDLFR